MNFLTGWKTYIVSVAMVLLGGGSLVGIDLPGVEMNLDPIQMILEGLGLGALRKGISG